VAGRQERFRQQHQQVVRAVAERQARSIDAQVARQPLLEFMAAAVRIQPHILERGAHRRDGMRARAVRVFVRGQLTISWMPSSRCSSEIGLPGT